MKGLKKYMAGILVAGMVLGSAAVPAPVYATEAEDAQEDNCLLYTSPSPRD